MNGKKGSIEINISTPTKPGLSQSGTKSGTSSACASCKARVQIQSVWNFCKEDSSRVIFPLKVGLAVLLVSLLVLFEAPYHVFGANIIWAILTAVLVFEYTVGATFNRGFNRAVGSLLAGILAIAVAQAALSSGHVAEPIIMGLSIFLIATITSFMKMWPSLVPYEYGFRVILLSYCLIIISGYRMGSPIKMMIDRLYSIAIGGIISVLVNVLVFPIWAGEQLHKELVRNFDSVADSLEECVKKYLDDVSEQSNFTTTVIDEFPDEPAYKRCRSTLNSGPKLETLANSARWEPPHGRFMHFLYPWSQYVKVGAVLRHCACEVMALHSILHSEIQAPHNLRIAFRSEIQEASSQAAELVRILGRDIGSMNWSLKNSLIKKVHTSTERLQRSMDLHSYLLLTPTFEPTSTTVPENPSNEHLPKLSHSPSLSTLYHPLPDQMGMYELNIKHPEKNPSNTPLGIVMPLPPAAQTEYSYHEIMRKQSRRLYSWPSREVDDTNADILLPKNRMRTFESTAAISLANFTSSLVEFVARVDHLIEAVDKLSKMAKFKHGGL